MDVNNIAIGGFAVILLVLFLTQTVREAFPNVPGRFLPLIALGVSVAIMALKEFAPEKATTMLATAIAVAATASLSVRYVKSGNTDDNNTEPTVINVAPPPVPAVPPPGQPVDIQSDALKLAKEAFTDVLSSRK